MWSCFYMLKNWEEKMKTPLGSDSSSIYARVFILPDKYHILLDTNITVCRKKGD